MFDRRTQRTLRAFAAAGAALVAQSGRIASIVQDFTDGDATNDAAAGLELHTVAAAVAEAVVAQLPMAAQASGPVGNMTRGAAQLLEGIVELARIDHKARDQRRADRRASKAAGAPFDPSAAVAAPVDWPAWLGRPPVGGK